MYAYVRMLRVEKEGRVEFKNNTHRSIISQAVAVNCACSPTPRNCTLLACAPHAVPALRFCATTYAFRAVLPRARLCVYSAFPRRRARNGDQRRAGARITVA